MLDAEQERRRVIEHENELTQLYEPHRVSVSDEWEFEITDHVNHAPTATPISDKTYTRNTGTKTINLNRIDPDPGDTQSWTKRSGPAAASISGNTLRFNTNHSSATRGTHNVRVRVTDGGGLYDETTVSILLENANSPPVFDASLPSTVNITLGQTVRINLVAYDNTDGDPITYTKNKAVGDLDSDSGSFEWIPTSVTQDTTIRFTASDGRGGTDTHDVAINIAPRVSTRVSPTLTRIGNKTRRGNGVISFSVYARDTSENRAMTFSANVGTFGDVTELSDGRYTARYTSPTLSASRNLTITARAVGATANATAAETIRLIIQTVVRPPTLDRIGNQDVIQGQNLIINVDDYATDPQNGTLTYSESGVGSINSETGRFIYTTTSSTTTGDKTAKITVTGPGGSVSETITITVLAPPVAITATVSISPGTSFELAAVNPSQITVTQTSVSSSGSGHDLLNYKSSTTATWTARTATVTGANRISSAIFAIPPQGQSYSCDFWAGVRNGGRVSNRITVTVSRLGTSNEPSITITSQQLGYVNPIRDRQSDVNGYIYYIASRSNGERFGWYSMDITMERKINNVWTDVTSAELNIPDDEFQNKRSSTFNVQVLINQLSLSGRFDYRIKLAYTDTVNNVAYTASAYTEVFSITWE